MKNLLLLFYICLPFINNTVNYLKISEKTTAFTIELPEKTSKRLFVIERNMNKNTVCYDANILNNGKIDTDNPIDAYWIDYATTGKRSELNYIQRRMAYGFSFEKTHTGNVYVTLKAFDKRKILVNVDNKGTPNALLKINGIDCKLVRIFVNAKPKLYTTVEYVELFGIDIKTGKSVSERITT
jgi:hypothetical protein